MHAHDVCLRSRPQVPLAQKTSPSGDVLTGESMRIRLVGREKEGVLLIARLGYDQVRLGNPLLCPQGDLYLCLCSRVLERS